MFLKKEERKKRKKERKKKKKKERKKGSLQIGFCFSVAPDEYSSCKLSSHVHFSNQSECLILLKQKSEPACL